MGLHGKAVAVNLLQSFQIGAKTAHFSQTFQHLLIYLMIAVDNKSNRQ